MHRLEKHEQSLKLQNGFGLLQCKVNTINVMV